MLLTKVALTVLTQILTQTVFSIDEFGQDLISVNFYIKAPAVSQLVPVTY